MVIHEEYNGEELKASALKNMQANLTALKGEVNNENKMRAAMAKAAIPVMEESIKSAKAVTDEAIWVAWREGLNNPDGTLNTVQTIMNNTGTKLAKVRESVKASFEEE